jgi:AcrR family transcriptional regulator
MATRIAKPKGAYHHGNLRKALVDAALELLRQGDASALSLRAVARRAQVSTAAPYRHFESREALLAAVAEEGFRMLASGMRTAMEANAGDPLIAFREAGVAYVLFALEHQAHYAVMFSPELADQSSHPDLATAAEESKALLLQAIRTCQQAGVVADGPPRELALAAWAVVHGLASLIAAGQTGVSWSDTGDAEAVARRVTSTLLTGVATGAQT